MERDAVARYGTAVALVGAVVGGVWLLSHPSGYDAAPRVLEGVDGVRVVATSPTGSGMDALAGGAVGVVGGCLGLPGVGGAPDLVLSFPRGARALEDEVGVGLPGSARRVHLGDVVELGGGMAPAGGDVRRACGVDEVWMVSGVDLVPAAAGAAPGS